MPSERIQRQVDRLLDEADEAIRRLDWSTVRDRAEAALALDHESADAQSYLAAAQEKLARPSDPPGGSSNDAAIPAVPALGRRSRLRARYDGPRPAAILIFSARLQRSSHFEVPVIAEMRLAQ